jgi:hypothetical protein
LENPVGSAIAVREHNPYVPENQLSWNVWRGIHLFQSAKTGEDGEKEAKDYVVEANLQDQEAQEVTREMLSDWCRGIFTRFTPTPAQLRKLSSARNHPLEIELLISKYELEILQAQEAKILESNLKKEIEAIKTRLDQMIEILSNYTEVEMESGGQQSTKE